MKNIFKYIAVPNIKYVKMLSGIWDMNAKSANRLAYFEISWVCVYPMANWNANMGKASLPIIFNTDKWMVKKHWNDSYKF